MPSRRLPQTHAARCQVVRKASLKGNNTPVADHPVPAARFARLNLTVPTSSASVYVGALGVVDAREQELSASTDSIATKFTSQRRLVSHFFQVFDFGIDRLEWPISHREYHHRDKNVAEVPGLSTPDDAVSWSGHIITGETERQADEGAGYIPMALPSKALVASGLAALTAAMGPHTTHRSALVTAQQAVEDLLPGPLGIEKLILDLYNDVENYFRDLPDGARRTQCREWGLLYEGDPISGGTDPGTDPLPLPSAPQNAVAQSGPNGSGIIQPNCEPAPAAENVTAYNIYRSGTLIGSSPTLPFDITGFDPGESVTITIRAVNATGEGPASEPVSGTAG